MFGAISNGKFIKCVRFIIFMQAHIFLFILCSYFSPKVNRQIPFICSYYQCINFSYNQFQSQPQFQLQNYVVVSL